MGPGLGLGFLKNHSFLTHPGSRRPPPPRFTDTLLVVYRNKITGRREDLGTRLNKIYFVKNFVMHQSIPAAPSPSHTGLLREFAHLVSPGGGAFANFALPEGRAFVNPELLRKSTKIITSPCCHGYADTNKYSISGFVLIS